MKPVYICIVASLAVLQLANTAIAAFTTHAKATASQTVRDFKVPTPGSPLASNEVDEAIGESGERVEVLAGPDPLTQGDASAFAEGYATAELGHLGVSVVGAVLGAAKNRPGTTSLGGRATSSAVASAEWLDTITIFVPDHIAVRAVFNLDLEGNVSASASGDAASSVDVGVSNPPESRLILPGETGELGFFLTVGSAFENPSNSGVVEVPGGFRVELIPPQGPFTIGLRLFASGSAFSNLSLDQQVWDADVASYSGELSRSLTWGGLEGVFDFFTGEKLDNWTITSESGFDYSQPFGVPEPSSIALVIAASCFWSRRARARV